MMPQRIEAAKKMEDAIMNVYEEGAVHTRDLGGEVSTTDFVSAVIEKIG
ncbi:MAG: hypothetical protein ACK5NT_12500 [Pyrinomonadaceae bacterium]